MYGFMWVVSIIVFLLLEAATYQFICIWFSGGALGALVACALGASLSVQVIVFFVVSGALLILTRPFVRKITNERKIKTNVEDVPGKIAKVIERIDNLASSGKVQLGAMEWSARTEDGSTIEAGETVEVLEVKGVKLIVRKKG